MIILPLMTTCRSVGHLMYLPNYYCNAYEVLNYSNNCKHLAYKYAVIKSIYMIFATNLLMALYYALKDNDVMMLNN